MEVGLQDGGWNGDGGSKLSHKYVVVGVNVGPVDLVVSSVFDVVLGFPRGLNGFATRKSAISDWVNPFK